MILWLGIINLFLIILFFILSYKDFRLKKIKKKYWIILIFITLVGLILRLLAPHRHLFFIDESFYMGAAKSITEYGRSFLTTGPYSKQIGWPILLSIPFLLFGVNNYIAIYTSMFFGILSIPLMFILTYLLTKNKKIAIISSFLLAIYPMHIKYSGSAEIIIPSIFFILLTLISFIIYTKINKKILLTLSILLLTFTIQIRLENLLIIFPIAYILWQKKAKKELYLFLITIPFILAYLFQFFQLTNFYTAIYNNKVNLFGLNASIPKFYFINILDILLIMLLLISIPIVYKENRRLFYISTLIFIPFLIFYSFYRYANDFHILTGIIALFPIISYFIIKNKKITTISAIIILILLMPSFPKSDSQYILETKVMPELKNDVPKNCHIVMEIQLIGSTLSDLRIIDTVTFINKEDYDLRTYKSNCLLFYEDIYCNSKLLPNSEKRCSIIKSKYNLTLYKQYKLDNIIYNLYNITNK